MVDLYTLNITFKIAYSGTFNKCYLQGHYIYLNQG